MFAKLAGHADYNGMPVWCTNLSLLAISALKLGCTALRGHSCQIICPVACQESSSVGGGSKQAYMRHQVAGLCIREGCVACTACLLYSQHTLDAVDLTTCNTFRVVCSCWVVVHAALHELARPCAHEEGAVGGTPQLLHSKKSSKHCLLSLAASTSADLL